MSIGNIIITFMKFLKSKILRTVEKITPLMYCYWSVYSFIGAFMTRRFPKAKNNHKYAIMIAARNESAVIGNLIESINRQDYPRENVTVFVVADNCTDNTAEISRKHGAVCYERSDPDHRTKGYALQFLVENIRRDYGIESFEAFFIFDADNLLKQDYLTRMNEAFDSGEKIVTSYRNTKNFNDNWIAASYGIHWLRTVRNEHRARSVLNLATRIQGTGFMFASEIIKDGWNYTSFTEDRAFAADSVVNGYRISYCDAAEFYDEQPTSLKIAMRQRIRWGKGHLQAFVELGPKLFGHIFTIKDIPNIQNKNMSNEDVSFFNVPNKPGHTEFYNRYDDAEYSPDNIVEKMGGALYCKLGTTLNSLFNAIRHIPLFKLFTESKFFKNVKFRFMSYDMFLVTFPNNVVSLFRRWLNVIAGIVINFVLAKTVVDYTNGIVNPIFAYICVSLSKRYVSSMMMAIYIFFVERKRIIKIPIWKKAFYCMMWPWFDIIGAVSVLIAMFSHVEWKAIPHNSQVDIETLSQNLSSKK